jgi:hypothetical protein
VCVFIRLLRARNQEGNNPFCKTGKVPPRVKYREIIADNLSKVGWSYGCISAVDSSGRTIWIVDAHRDNGKRLVVRADEKLIAFLELEAAVRVSG